MWQRGCTRTEVGIRSLLEVKADLTGGVLKVPT
jgi:hypothetical protein